MSSIREIAEAIVRQWEGDNPIDTEDAANLSGAIEQALNAERERAAKIADIIKKNSRTLTAKNTAMTIASAIRDKEPERP